MAGLFDQKYEEFARDLLSTFPELKGLIESAVGLGASERREGFKTQVLPSCSPTRDSTKAPEYVLPGVALGEKLWTEVSDATREAIQKHLTVLSFAFLMEQGGDLSGTPWNAEWAEKMMEDLKGKMDKMDFAGLSEKFAKLFGGMGGDGKIPEIPEKFKNGQIARLAEEIMKELKPEDFGFTKEQMDSAGNDPAKALNIITDVFMKNPQVFQNTIQRLTKKLQAKIQSGALRPQELVAEAEELMKTFTSNPQFVELMETFRNTFGMAEDPDLARATGNDGSGRLAMARARLRKKLDAKKGGKK